MDFVSHERAAGVQLQSGGSFWSSVEKFCEDSAVDVTVESVMATTKARREIVPALRWRGAVAVMLVDDFKVPLEMVIDICGYSAPRPRLSMLRELQRTRRLISQTFGGTHAADRT